MKHQELINFLENTGKDPSRLIFEDELTEIYNRRFLLHYFQHKISWTRLKNAPLSLIMIDVDHFKQINDTYGHQVGDKVLAWLAALLREMTAEQGLPVRYAGDEFMVLLLRKDPPSAMALADGLIKRVRENPIHIEGLEGELQVTLSIGVASAPHDAQSGKELIKKADVALYYAKESGRDCVINAGEVAQESVFTKTAINQLERIKLVGRKQQLSEITAALSRFSQQHNQFLIAEGPEGIGKSEFLETIRRNLARINIWRVKVSGEPQELLRPYYLMTKILLELLNQYKNKAVAVVESVSPEERAYIAQIIPQMGPGLKLPKNFDQTAQRQFIFKAVHNFFVKLVGGRPIILFIDDMQYIDAATLSLLRLISMGKRVSIFVCGAATTATETGMGDPTIPLEIFFNKFQLELDIRKVTLTPMTKADIAEHIRGIFPNVRVPDNFEHEIAQITRGNPLFITEILRQLIQDRRITLDGHQWIIEPLEEGYLPQSIEEMVVQKISGLDPKSREMLNRMSALGEDVSLSILTGSSDKQETEVLECINQAAAQGLLTSEFERNDEIIRFLGKRILKATYEAVEDQRKLQLHEQIGNYKESLYSARLLPSVSPLAYHFKRSANTQKAKSYHEVQTVSDARAFNAQEAAFYVVEETSAETAVAGKPLKSEDLQRMPKFIRLFMVAVRNIRLYPAGSKSIINASRQLYSIIE
jgi:diguanylate cyclase (GGDEF)-like protein